MTRHYNSNSKKQAKKKANFHEKESNVDVNKASNSNMMEIDANATNALQTFATSTNASIINTKEPISPHSIEDSSNTFNDNGNSGSNVEDNKMTQEWVVVNKYTNFRAAILIDQIPKTVYRDVDRQFES
ncbi:276_t:CDS:2 [Entrophospora sp. SA101]|nr:276_t:CDS:2 [Entrophospora sp. SA101]